MGFVDPPLEITARGRTVRLEALNARGRLLVPAMSAAITALAAAECVETRTDVVTVRVRPPARPFTEEERSRQSSIFSALRALIDLFSHPDEPHLGVYGAFGYDLAFQFEPIRLRLDRPADQRDLVLYLPDELVIVDHRREHAERRRYDFEAGTGSTKELPRAGSTMPYVAGRTAPPSGDHAPGEYAAVVRLARDAFKRGDLFEVVPGQTFFEPCQPA